MSFIPTLIETVRVRNRVAPLWYLHLRRLSESCRTLGVPFPLTFEVPSGGPDRVASNVGGRFLRCSTMTDVCLALPTSSARLPIILEPVVVEDVLSALGSPPFVAVMA